MNEKLLQATRAAVERGFDFVERVVAVHGAWPKWRYDNMELAGERYVEDPHPPITNALAVLALDACRHPRAAALAARTREFLASWMRYPGIWRYRRDLPADVDNVAMSALAVGPHPWLRMGRLWGANVGALLSNRDGEGRFLTWMLNEPGLDNNVDAVVNADVLAYIGDHPETRAAERWVETVLADGREVEDSPYYVDPLDLHFAMVRASCLREGLFGGLRPTLASLLLERLRGGEGADNPMRTAQALSGLDMLGAGLDEATRSSSLAALVESQLPDGSWPARLMWREPTGWAIWAEAIGRPQRVDESWGFASEAIATVFCIEAMERSLASSETVDRA